jgi:single stranded DNA-binding protein
MAGRPARTRAEEAVHEPTIFLTGHLAAKPNLKTVESAQGTTVVANMRIAVTPRRKPRDADDWADGETMWFNVSAWRTTAANSVSSLNQGDRVVVRGRLTQRTWRDAEGVERPSMDVEADDVAIDISRYPAMSLRRPPAQRSEEPPVGVDRETGEIMAPETEPDTEPEDVPVPV